MIKSIYPVQKSSSERRYSDSFTDGLNYINKQDVNLLISWVRRRTRRSPSGTGILPLQCLWFYRTWSLSIIKASRAHFSNMTPINVKGRLEIKNPRRHFKNAGIKMIYHFSTRETNSPNMRSPCIFLLQNYTCLSSAPKNKYQIQITINQELLKVKKRKAETFLAIKEIKDFAFPERVWFKG